MVVIQYKSEDFENSKIKISKIAKIDTQNEILDFGNMFILLSKISIWIDKVEQNSNIFPFRFSFVEPTYNKRSLSIYNNRKRLEVWPLRLRAGSDWHLRQKKHRMWIGFSHLGRSTPIMGFLIPRTQLSQYFFFFPFSFVGVFGQFLGRSDSEWGCWCFQRMPPYSQA